MTKLRSILREAPIEVVREVESEGWTLEMTGGNHVKWLHPSGAFVYGASTPSDRRAWANHLSRLRRARARIT